MYNANKMKLSFALPSASMRKAAMSMALPLLLALILVASPASSAADGGGGGGSSVSAGGGGSSGVSAGGGAMPVDEAEDVCVKCSIRAKEPEYGEYIIETSSDGYFAYEIVAESDIDDVSMMHFRIDMPNGGRGLVFKLPDAMGELFTVNNMMAGNNIVIQTRGNRFVSLSEGDVLVEALAKPPAPAPSGVTECVDVEASITYFRATTHGTEEDQIVDYITEVTQPSASSLADMYSKYDVNRDHMITLEDVDSVRALLGANSDSPGWGSPEVMRCDLQEDGVIDMLDLLQVIMKYESVTNNEGSGS